MDRLKVAVCTWNVAGNSTSAPNADLDEWLHLEEKPEVLTIHLLEVLDINNPLSYGQQVRSSCRVAVDVLACGELFLILPAAIPCLDSSMLQSDEPLVMCHGSTDCLSRSLAKRRHGRLAWSSRDWSG